MELNSFPFNSNFLVFPHNSNPNCLFSLTSLSPFSIGPDHLFSFTTENVETIPFIYSHTSQGIHYTLSPLQMFLLPTHSLVCHNLILSLIYTSFCVLVLTSLQNDKLHEGRDCTLLLPNILVLCYCSVVPLTDTMELCVKLS